MVIPTMWHKFAPALNRFKRVQSRILAIVALALTLLSGSCGSSSPSPGPNTPKKSPNHHALRIISYYETVKTERHPVSPFRVNILALDMLKRGNGKTVNLCRDYIRWYLNHVNLRDRYGLSGTIYDYDADFDGKEYSLNTYRDIDATTASFILLLHRFYKKSGYKNILEQNRKKIEDVAYVIPHLMDEKDGLIHSAPVGDLKLLENNCLCYAAMEAYVDLTGRLGWGKQEFYRETAGDIRAAIRENLYRAHRLEFYWKAEGGDKYSPDWNIEYPDRYSQLFPMLFDILEEPNRRKAFKNRCIRYFDQPWSEENPLRVAIIRWARQKIADIEKSTTINGDLK